MPAKLIERAQTGVRMEKSLLKVLKGLAEYCNISLGDLLEGIVLHSFDSKPPFSDEKAAIKNSSLSVTRLPYPPVLGSRL